MSEPEPQDFYVYAIFRRDGSPCYIGKGRGDRYQRHAKRTSNRRLAKLYAEADGKLPAIKVREELTNAQAIALEIALIKAIGRGRNGPLVNFTDGGEGTSGYKKSEKIRAKQREYWNSPDGELRKAKQRELARIQLSDNAKKNRLIEARKKVKSKKLPTLTQEQRDRASHRISVINKTRTISEEQRNKRRDNMKRMWEDKDIRARIVRGKKEWAENNIDVYKRNIPKRGKNGRFRSVAS